MSGNKRLHIAIACPACGPPLGSVAAVAVRHYTELSRYFRVTLISDSLPPEIPAEDRDRVTPRRFDYLRRFCHVPNEYSFARSVRRRLSEVHEIKPIDMVICHGHALARLAATPLKRERGVPFALVTHGDIFERPKGTYDVRLTRYYKWVTPPAYRNADIVIALSPDMARRAVAGGARPEAVRVIPNGIDPADIGLEDGQEQASPRESRQAGALRLLYVGALAITKGVDVLIEACEILSGRRVIFSLSIIGVGPMESKLRKQAAKAGLDGSIKFLGPVPRRELGGYYKSADIVCVPSISDPLPTVALEALASGTPVIGSDVGGIPFIIEHGFSGVIVRPRDSEDLADAIQGLSGDNAALAKLGNNARRSAIDRFRWHSVGSRIRELIEEVALKRVAKAASSAEEFHGVLI